MKNEFINKESFINEVDTQQKELAIIDFIAKVKMTKINHINTYRQEAQFTLDFIENADPIVIGNQMKLMYERLKNDLKKITH